MDEFANWDDDIEFDYEPETGKNNKGLHPYIIANMLFGGVGGFFTFRPLDIYNSALKKRTTDFETVRHLERCLLKEED